MHTTGTKKRQDTERREPWKKKVVLNLAKDDILEIGVHGVSVEITWPTDYVELRQQLPPTWGEKEAEEQHDDDDGG